jgi:hypothetical protein
MFILRSGPLSRRAKRNRDAFLRLVGECVTRWAFTDRALFLLFRQALDIDVKSAGTLYYRLTTLSSKLALTDAVIKLVATPTNLKVWKTYKKKMDQLIPIRNIVAHHPLLQSTSGTRHQYFIRVEPYEVEAGYRAPRMIDAKILRAHATHVDNLTHRLAAFGQKITADAQFRKKSLTG